MNKFEDKKWQRDFDSAAYKCIQTLCNLKTLSDLYYTFNPRYKRHSKKWSSLDFSFFVQLFLIFHAAFGLMFLVFSRVF